MALKQHNLFNKKTKQTKKAAAMKSDNSQGVLFGCTLFTKIYPHNLQQLKI